MPKTHNPIKERIMTKGKGWVFFPSDFYDISSPEAVRQCLSRMVKNKEILRLDKGIYCNPKSNKLLGIEIIPPSFDDIAKRVAERDGVKIIPSGDYALNRIGLSTQVPANAVYLTNGARKSISVGEGKGIIFKESNELRLFNFVSEIMMLAISSMRAIGEKLITKEQISYIKNLISKVPKEDFSHDILLAPIWVRKCLENK